MLENIKGNKIPLNLTVPGLTPVDLFLGEGLQSLEVATLCASTKPSIKTMHSAFKIRRDGRASPVLIVVKHPKGVTICGVSGNQPPIFNSDDLDLCERICSRALELPNRNRAIEFLHSSLRSIDSKLSGITNEGLLSLHVLNTGIQSRIEWKESLEKSKKLVRKSKEDLISALGYDKRKLDNLTDILISKDERIAVAVILRDEENPEFRNERFNRNSPVSYALTKADKENLPWVIIVQDERIRLYSTKNRGVGRSGRTESYIECQPSLLSSENCGLLWLLFSSKALNENGYVENLLGESKRFAANIAIKLRDRIYDSVIPQLAKGIIEAKNIKTPKEKDLSFIYQMSITVMFRLLFIAYAEDRDLLPFKTNEAYRNRSLKNKAIELAEFVFNGKSIGTGNHHWSESVQLWKAISKGNKEWGVPAYNGIMFSDLEYESEVGAEIAKLNISNIYFERALGDLLLNESEESQYSPIDFRSLSVREFGTIYEGLLESELSLAIQNLTRNKDGVYIPANGNDKVEIKEGEIYLHNRSGARKASGSYYTPEFAVEFLLDESLESALDDHLYRLSDLDQVDQAEQLFEFRVADISMGSGHFLVAAIDRIERRFAMWLEENPNPFVRRELEILKKVAYEQLSELDMEVSIEDGQLLRRLIAKRCIFGVDLNFLAVQLARLSIWIHTFVPGLPLSLLDHNLIQGNALIGIGSMEEIYNKFSENDLPLFEVDSHELLGAAAENLKKLASLSDASLGDINEGRKLIEDSEINSAEARALCDLIIAQPVSKNTILSDFMFADWRQRRETIQNSKELKQARKILEPFSVVHFPIAFPEVFLGRTKGFNVILGNPPWEELKMEERDFWTLQLPNNRSLSQGDQEKKWTILKSSRPDLVKIWNRIEKETSELAQIIKTGNFPGIEVGDLDLYKAFTWRFLNVTSDEVGKIGVLLPRTAFMSLGSSEFRKKLFSISKSINITSLQNTGKWVFDIHPQYTIILTNISKGNTKNNVIRVRGPFKSREEFDRDIADSGFEFKIAELKHWNDAQSIPLFPSSESGSTFTQLRSAPRLDLDNCGEWRARPYLELSSTSDKKYFDMNSKICPEGYWPVYKGASFDIWEPDSGVYYAFANPKKMLPILQRKRLNALRSKRDSVYKEFPTNYIEDETSLGANRPRITFRLITRATDSRTLRVALTPPKVFHVNSSQLIAFPRGDEKDEAYLIGILSSIPLDWYTRRFVEINFNFYLFNPLPIPRPIRNDPLWKQVVLTAGRLACPDDRFSNWAKEVGVECGPISELEKTNLICKLDAIVAHLYKLNEDQLVHIFETFHTNSNYSHRLESVLHHYRNL